MAKNNNNNNKIYLWNMFFKIYIFKNISIFKYNINKWNISNLSTEVIIIIILILIIIIVTRSQYTSPPRQCNTGRPWAILLKFCVVEGFRENRPVTVWEMPINLLKSFIPGWWGKWKNDPECISRSGSPPKVNKFFRHVSMKSSDYFCSNPAHRMTE